MEWFLSILSVIAGLALLVKGADWFVDGSAGVAGKCKISPLIIGLTVVAFGTSAPELCVSVASAIRHSAAEIAIGNVVGSNVANILLILGLSALIHDLPVSKNSLVLDLPVLLFASALLVGLGAWGWKIEWWDGLVLLAVFIAYLTVLIVNAKKSFRGREPLPSPDGAEEKREEAPKGKVGQWYARMKEKTWFLIVLTLVGLGMVVGGGTLLVSGAQKIAELLSVPPRIIALTVVAIGTSLPELVTSVVAAKKGETDIAVGNIIGSNIFNILLIAGVSSLINPLPFVPEKNMVDALVALAAVVLLYVLALFKGHKIGKAGGALMLACFAGYYVYLFVG